MEHTLANAVHTKDRSGNSAYVWADGHHIAKDGAGRMCWSLYLPGDTMACSYFSDRLYDAVGNI